MSPLVIKNAVAILPDRLMPEPAVRCVEGKIAEVAPSAELKPARGDEVVDAGGAYLAPGYIDMHVHGVHRHLIDDGVGSVGRLLVCLRRAGFARRPGGGRLCRGCHGVSPVSRGLRPRCELLLLDRLR